MTPQKQESGERLFESRMAGIKIIFISLFIIVFSYLLRIQVFSHKNDTTGKYQKIEVPVPRGTIHDRNGVVLAMSVPFYSLYIDSWEVKHREKNEPSYTERLKKEIVSILKLKSSEVEDKFTQKYPLIKKELSIEEYTALKTANLPGIVFYPGYKRVYPHGRLACHIVGFSGTDGEGLEGIESYYNSLLEGEKGLSLILKDGSGELVHSIEKTLILPKQGKDLYLTIDSSIQFMVEEEIKTVYEKYNASNVSAIVIDYETGEILSMANLPDYNPNDPGHFSLSDRRNRAVTDLFEPGSTFKIVTAAAAIEEEIFSPDDIIYCEKGKWFVRNHYLRDVHPYGRLKVREVIEKSSNIGTVKIAMGLGEQTLYSYCTQFGFGTPTGIDLPGEIHGILRPLNRWSGYSITAVPIGQEVGINALQGIRAMAAIANGGYLVNPHILKSVKEDSKEIPLHREKNRQKILSEGTCEILKDILKEAISTSGTAPLAHIPGYSISGKTGTAQKIIEGRYSKNRYVASFIGFLNNPAAKMLILVKVDEPKPIYYGGLVAAPVFRNILWRTLQQKNIPPSGNIEDHRMVMGQRE
jgi:cell division protein FtsI (penicillin-binding protein 3)